MLINLPTNISGCKLPEQYPDGLWYIEMAEFPAHSFYLGIQEQHSGASIPYVTLEKDAERFEVALAYDTIIAAHTCAEAYYAQHGTTYPYMKEFDIAKGTVQEPCGNCQSEIMRFE